MGAPDATRMLLRLACFAPLAAAPVLTNWISTTPPVEHWMESSLGGFADTLIAGKPIWTSEDLRALKAAWIARMPAGKDVVILGLAAPCRFRRNGFSPGACLTAGSCTETWTT
jgi:hypothetical protein